MFASVSVDAKGVAGGSSQSSDADADVSAVVPESSTDGGVEVASRVAGAGRASEPRRAVIVTVARASGMLGLPVEVWIDPVITPALAARDIGAVFRHLQVLGLSQRRIAELTGQSQSEVHEILHGRAVISCWVLERLAQRLGIPPGSMGLAYDPPLVEPAGARRDPGGDLLVAGLNAPRYKLVPVSKLRVARARRARSAPGTQRNWAQRRMRIIDSAEQTTKVKRPRPSDAVASKQPPAREVPDVPRRPVNAIAFWTGLHVRAMRDAMRMTVRQFADYLGVSDRVVSKWETGGLEIRPRPFNQQSLDVCLRGANAELRERFTTCLYLYYHTAVGGPEGGEDQSLDRQLGILRIEAASIEETAWTRQSGGGLPGTAQDPPHLAIGVIR